MSEPLVIVTREGHVARLTLNRPKALNALSTEMLEAIYVEVKRLSTDRDLRCLVITGNGKGFIAGADITEMASKKVEEAREFAAFGHKVFEAIESFPTPVIAAVNGFCLGGGCELALSCDMVYASARAKFGQPEVKLGLIPGFGGTQRLARRIGTMRAAELIYTGRMIKADEALRIGLCIEVCEPAELLTKVDAVAASVAAQAPLAVRACKRVIQRGVDGPLATGNALEREAFGVLFDTHDTREGMIAFLDKRAAVFENR